LEEIIGMKRIRRLCFLLVPFFVFSGCDLGTDLPFSTRTEWREDGFFQFSTNEHWRYGYVFRNNFYNVDSNDDKDTENFEIEVKKISGNRHMGFGMIFGQVDDGRHFYVIINVNGQYMIGRRNLVTVTDPHGGTSQDFVDQPILGRTLAASWMDSDRLRRGVNRANTIRVERSGTTFVVFFNGYEVDRFSDGFIIAGTHDAEGHRIGFRASVGTNLLESFPNTPVDVRFRLIR